MIYRVQFDYWRGQQLPRVTDFQQALTAQHAQHEAVMQEGISKLCMLSELQHMHFVSWRLLHVQSAGIADTKVMNA